MQLTKTSGLDRFEARESYRGPNMGPRQPTVVCYLPARRELDKYRTWLYTNRKALGESKRGGNVSQSERYDR